MSKETIETIKNCLQQEYNQEEIEETANKLLLDMILLADEHEFSKHGLIKEIQHGINPRYTTTVSWKNKEIVDLDLERLAMTGQKRLEIEDRKGELEDEKTSSYPEKIVMADLEV